MPTLSIDIETYSSVNLIESGVYPYVEAPDFTILLFAYAFDNGPVEIVDIARGEDPPPVVLNSLANPEYIKTAFNASFERICISKYLGVNLPVEQWSCTMIHSLMLGLPGSLDAVGKTLKLSDDLQKSATGKALIKYFSVPCKPTKVNGGRTRNLPEHDMAKWAEFKEYCRQDVEAERAIKNKISRFYRIPEKEKRLYCLDQKINDAGISLDLNLVRHAIMCDVQQTDKLTKESKKLTRLENPNSVAQLKTWLYTYEGIRIDSITKDTLPEIIKQAKNESTIRVLNIRKELSKTSVKKYTAMQNCVRADGRAGGLLQFYGANRTGRWAGRLIQVQNLPRNKMPDLDLARAFLADGRYDDIEMLWPSTANVLSQLIRTSFVAQEGCRFIVSDFSAIEARVIAWLADEKWRLDVFATHGKIYEASASQMFKVPIEEITKGSPLRQKGKVAELALGYQGSSGALVQMGALNMGLTEDELPEIVEAWRGANKNIVKLWYDVDKAALNAVEEKTTVRIQHGVKFIYSSGILFIELPSGRRLSYLSPKIGENKWGAKSITYEGMNQTTKQFTTLETYGGKLVENIVQAIARDCLAESMLRLDDAGYKIVMHVHDEAILEVPDGCSSCEEVAEIMGRSIDWAKGLPLRADSYETKYYKKD